MSDIALIIAAHPDDELLGVGGTVAKLTEEGVQAYCLILGQGALSRDAGTEKEAELLEKQAKEAGDIIGFKKIFFARFPDNAFDTVSLLQITKFVEKIIEEIKPQVVYTHHEYDLNIDHRLTFQAVLTACRPCNTFCPKELYTFETLSSTEWQSKDHKQFEPTVYTAISGTIEKKIQALSCYAGEMRNHPHSRSLEGVRILAKYRGLEAHLPYAEAFRLIRKISV